MDVDKITGDVKSSEPLANEGSSKLLPNACEHDEQLEKEWLGPSEEIDINIDAIDYYCALPAGEFH